MSTVTKPLTTLVDELGKLRAKIADLTTKEEELKETLRNSGESEIEGRLFRVTVSRTDVATVNWKEVANRLNPSSQLVNANTTVKERVTVKVVARK